MKKKLLSALLAFALSLGTATIPAAAAEVDSAGGQVSAQLNTVSLNGRTSSNVDRHIYNVWSKPVRSYLTEKADGTLERVEYDSENGKLFYEWYSSDGKTLKKSAEITNELELFGGFYSGSSNNFLVFGQNNYSEDNSREVMRVVKYTKDWKRISSASVKGENTYIPFDAGSLRMAEYAGDLYIHTSHEMYEFADGLHHQSNMSFVMHENNMTIERWHSGYVSHSFNQFIKEDGKGVYRVDHGDAYPRAIAINKYLTSDALWNSIETEAVDLSNTGDIGDNVTGASVGGFELSGNNCIIAFNAVDFERKDVNVYDTRNIWLSVTDKNLSSSRNIKITDYSADSSKEITTPQLVKINDNRFLLMWEEFDNNTVYTKLAVVNADGKMDSQGIVTSDVTLSDCQPILCKDGLVRWYAGFGKNPVLYTVNPSALSQSANTISVYQKKPVIQKVENTGSGISLQWNNCYGADRYIVYYRPESEKEWDYDYTYDTSYTLNHLKPGVRYCFQVCAHSYYDNTNYYSNVVSKTYEIPPSLSLSNNSAGLTAAWSSTGADSYVVYYRPAERSTWSSFTATGNKAVIPNTESGKLYCVQVQNIINGKKGAYSKVQSMTYLARANMTTLTYNGSNALQWSAVDGANQYQIARKKTGDQAYTYYTTTETGFAEQNVTAGTTYTYQVRAMYKTEKNGTAYGAWSSSKSVVTIEKPELRLSNKKNGVRLEWNAAKGAVKYVVYYKKAGDKSWSSTTTANTYYPYLNVTEGQQYYFQLRAIGQNLNGPYSNVVSKTYEISPSLSLSNNSAGLTAAWSSTGADSYVVYYRPAERSTWSSFTATGNKAVIPNTESGKLYCVQVQNIINGKKGAYSKVQSMTYLARANMTTLTYNGSNALQWSAVDGANQYQIARKKTGDQAYTYYTTTETGFAEQNVTAGTTYTYQVRAMYKTEKNGTAYGAWSSSKSVVTIEKPELRLSNKKNGVRLEWNAAKGAVKYVVYYKKAGDKSWSSTTTANTYYPYLNVTEGQQYYFQLRAIGQNLNGPYSKVQTKVFYNPYK